MVTTREKFINRPSQRVLMSTTYGIISDIHGAPPQLAALAMDILKGEEADALILNGDIDGERFCARVHGMDDDNYIDELLHAAARTGLETYVQPGSHEELGHFDPPVQVLSRRYGNIINVLEHPKIEREDHHLVFLPGSDVAAGNTVLSGYRLTCEIDGPSGYYQVRTPEGIGQLRVTAMQDLRKLVTQPEKTIVISHVPPHCNDLKTGIDRAEFGEAAGDFHLEERLVGAGAIFPGPVAKELQARGYPVNIQQENRGNVDLRTLTDELDITKFICGHFHESVHHAHDRAGAAVEEGKYSNELFWNASYLDALKVGLLSVNEGKVAYENIDLRKYSPAR